MTKLKLGVLWVKSNVEYHYIVSISIKSVSNAMVVFHIGETFPTELLILS